MASTINDTGAALPVSWGTTVGTVSQPAIPGNPSRKGLIFINASVGVAIAISPAQTNLGLNGVYAATAASIAVINGAGSITMQPGDKFIIDTMNCSAAWVCVAGGAGGVLSILES